MKKHYVNFFKKHYQFLIIFTFAPLLYFYNIGFSDLWSDEYFTKMLITNSFADMVGLMKNDLHPPLYFAALKLFTAAFGVTTFTMRLFSVIAVLSTILLGYVAGQRVFGKQGALYFCLMLIAMPMLASYSHEARMYTWAAFSVTGVFLYAHLFLSTGKKSDLIMLGIFTFLALYIHYYSLVAALAANIFVFMNLVWKRDKKWLQHVIAMGIVCALFLPWVYMFIGHFQRVQRFFWAQEISWELIITCFTFPFAEKFWLSNVSVAMVLTVYGITLFTIIRGAMKRSGNYNLALYLSLFIFLFTIFAIIVVSLVSQPILYFRYIMAIVTMIMVPPTIFIASLKNKWLKNAVAASFLIMGITISVRTSYFSFGPYKQTVEHIADAYPEVHKVLHISEITAGPMIEYNGHSTLGHYWLESKVSNVDIFEGLHREKHLADFLEDGELFCAVNFNDMTLNQENLEHAIAESNLIKIDTVRDNKVEYGNTIVVFLMRYNGKSIGMVD